MLGIERNVTSLGSNLMKIRLVSFKMSNWLHHCSIDFLRFDPKWLMNWPILVSCSRSLNELPKTNFNFETENSDWSSRPIPGKWRSSDWSVKPRPSPSSPLAPEKSLRRSKGSFGKVRLSNFSRSYKSQRTQAAKSVVS